MKVSVLSPCFYPSADYAEPLMTSAKRHNFKVQLYGVGEPFVSYFDAKVLRLRDELRKIRTRYTIYIDCRDVLWLDGPHKVMDAFFQIRAEQKKDLVVGTETYLWPFRLSEFRKFYKARGKPFGEWKFCHPAPGMIVGRTDAMIALMDELVATRPVMEADAKKAGLWKAKFEGDDMVVWTWAMPHGIADVALDYGCQMTTVLRRELRYNFEVSPGRVRRLNNNALPVVIHFNQRQKDRGFFGQTRKVLWGDAA